MVDGLKVVAEALSFNALYTCSNKINYYIILLLTFLIESSSA